VALLENLIGQKNKEGPKSDWGGWVAVNTGRGVMVSQ